MLSTLQSIEPSILTGIVRQDQRSADFEITSWSVRKLSDQGMINPDGLFCFSGSGRDSLGERSWSVVLKILKEQSWNQAVAFNWYWKREALAYQSGLLSNLPGPLRAARGYGVQEYAGEAWIWMEHLTDRLEGRWDLEQHVFAAHCLGQFNGANLNGAPLPDYPWLNKSQDRDWASGWSPEDYWDHPTVLEVIPPNDLGRFRQLWLERERYFAISASLPGAFSHFDFKRRNLFLLQRADGSDEVVAIDWAECGIGALGRDLAYVVGSNVMFFEFEASKIREIDEAVFAAYLSGLRDSGWQGDPEEIRLGYTIWFSQKFGFSLPRGIVGMLSTEEARLNLERSIQRPAGEIAEALSIVCSYVADCANEAHRLAEKRKSPTVK